jgi:hypothetical protein
VGRVHTKQSRVLVNEFSISCDLNRYGLTHSRNLSDVTTLCDEGNKFIPGLLSGSLTLAGFIDATAGSFYSEAVAANGVDDGFQVLVAPAGYTLGNPAFITVSDLSEFDVAASVADAVTVSVNAMPDAGVDWGVMLHALTAETSDDDGDTVDSLASSSNGGVGALHVTAYSGLTNIIVKIQDSPDDSAWSDLITFTTATGVTFQRSTVTGTVDRYLRASWDVTGTGSATFAVAFARR